MENTVVKSLEQAFIPFASEALLNNLPFIGDGLLAVQRKSIWGMLEHGLTHDKGHSKMLKAQGHIMNYYVFGDMPLTGALKNMGNNTVEYKYLDTEGSYGDKRKRDDSGSAARYLECRLSEYAESLCKGVYKNSVPMKRNYDNSCDEPIVLPSQIPNIILNSSMSIAVGESSKIPAHNLNEVCDAFISYLQDGDLEKSISYIKGCDLSTGGNLIHDKKTLSQIYNTGRGSFTVTGKYKYDEVENIVIIYEVPYGCYIEDIEDKLRLGFEKGYFKEVSDIHDGSDKDGLALKIYLKKNTNVNTFIKKLRKYTPYESKVSCNFTMIDIDNKTPRLMSLKDIIVQWVKFRKQCLKRELQYDLNQLLLDQNKLNGLNIIQEDLDKSIKIIRSSKTEKEAVENLINEFGLNKAQADYISTIRLVNMNNEWLTKQIDKLNNINKQIEESNNNLNNDSYYSNLIIEQLEKAKKKYGIERKTKIIYEDDTNMSIEQEMLIEDYNCQLVVTKEGYVKKTLKYSNNQKLKDGDCVISQTQTTNKSKILAFTNLGNCYFYNTYHLNDTQPSNLGQYLPSLISLENGEQIVYITVTSDFTGHLLFAYENGKVAKITLSS